MAISDSAYVLNNLKVDYQDGVESLLFRPDPVTNKIKKYRVEGKQQSFSALWGHGGGVSADFTVSKDNATKVAHNAEFTVTPGQLFSSYTINGKEIQASRSKKGAYMPWAGEQMAAATNGFRTVMAASLYGNGYGVIGSIRESAGVTFTANTAVTIQAPSDLIIKVDVDTVLAFKASETSATSLSTAVVTSVDEANGTITIVPNTTVATVPQGTVIAYYGAMDPSGNPIFPVGLQDWLPIKNGRTGTDWTNYINNAFFGVNRSVAPDRLAGSYHEAAANEKVSDSIQKLLQKVRRHGSKADLIILNEDDFMTFSNEIQSTNTYFTATSTKGKREANVGFDKLSASFSTNYIDNVYDTPYLPKGLAYILDSDVVQFWGYTNAEKLDNPISGNEPGKATVDELAEKAEDGKGKGNYGLLIDDVITVTPGVDSWEGPSVLVTLQVYGSYVVRNPSVCGVAVLSTADDKTLLPGWK